MEHTEVLIVGAGPTGLVLALHLARQGIGFRIIDRNSGPGQDSRAMVLQARTLEFYQFLGLAEEVVHSGIIVRGLYLWKDRQKIAEFPFGHFGEGISPYAFALSFPQDDHEKLLLRHLQRAGADVEWNTELTDFAVQEGGVVAQFATPNGGNNVRAAFLSGCDGARGTVRQRLGVEFPGGTYEQTFFVADVRASGPPLNGDVNICLGPDTFYAVFPVRSSGTFRLIGTIPSGLGEEASFDDVRPSVEKQLDARLESCQWYSRYRVHHRVAQHFQRTPVFLCGDAAHLHSPAGGQGMNTGIGDAVNLAWKLADVARGRARPSLLETYELERRRFALGLVKSTDRAFEGAVGKSLLPRLFRSVAAPHLLPTLLHVDPVRRAMFRLVSQIRINYRTSPLSDGRAGDVRGGDRLPWTGENFRPLGSADWQVHVYGATSPTVRDAIAACRLPLHQFGWNRAAEEAGLAQDALYLVRPDGHVALADPSPSPERLQEFLERFDLRVAMEQPPEPVDQSVRYQG
ncbi:MAG TPA: FAD-dependent monooxygenase [Candidatus Xenobia bacterium]